MSSLRSLVPMTLLAMALAPGAFAAGSVPRPPVHRTQAPRTGQVRPRDRAAAPPARGQVRPYRLPGPGEGAPRS